MSAIRVVWGAATAATKLASYDAALADANVHDYNLVTVSSVIPADATLEVVGEAPDLGPAGERLTVVEGRATVAPRDADRAERTVAGLGWSRASEGPGIFYEAAGTDVEAVRECVDEGLAAGRRLREWAFADDGYQAVTAEADGDGFATAVVLAVYGKSTPLL